MKNKAVQSKKLILVALSSGILMHAAWLINVHLFL